MYTVEKNGKIQQLRDAVQLSAYLKSGWTIQEPNSEETPNVRDKPELDLALLKEQADELGIEYSKNIGAVKLAKRIQEYLSENKPEVKESNTAENADTDSVIAYTTSPPANVVGFFDFINEE